MIIALNTKKTVLMTTIGICFLGSLYAAYKLYNRSKANNSGKRRKQSAKSSSKNNTNHSGKVSNQRSTQNENNNKTTTNRQQSLAIDINSTAKTNMRNAAKANRQNNVRSRLLSLSSSDEVKNLPAEELLELGLNYLSQAIRSWETALDSIESAAYMQSNTLALPNDEHADLVYKLRNLVEQANNITSNCNAKLVKSSQTLQIIQSRLAYKQQLYAEALLKNNAKHQQRTNDEQENADDLEDKYKTSSNQMLSSSYGKSGEQQQQQQLASSFNKASSYYSDDDNESFVSADSDVDWLNEEMFQNIENKNDKNVLYEMALSNVCLGRVSYRVSRAELLTCKSDDDFAAKLHVLRLGFDRLMQNSDKRQWMIEQGKQLLANLMRKAEKDCTNFFKAYDEMVRFVGVESNWKNIKDELATRDVLNMNFYDIALDFIILDAFDDLESPPSAITAVIQNRWLSQSFKETALSTAVWSILKAKRKLLKYPDGFITRFYSITEYLVPVLAWGFLGTDEELTKSCCLLKSTIVEYLRCLFDLNRTRYTNLEDLTQDIDQHSMSYLTKLCDSI